MNSMILTTPSKIGASVKLQFIICIWTLKNQIWKNEFCCVHWPCDTMLTFPLKIQSFEKRKRHKFFVSYFWYFFSQKLFLLKTFTCFKTLSISGKNKMKRREFISDFSILTQIRIFCYCCLQNVRKNVRMNSWKPLKR